MKCFVLTYPCKRKTGEIFTSTLFSVCTDEYSTQDLYQQGGQKIKRINGKL